MIAEIAGCEDRPQSMVSVSEDDLVGLTGHVSENSLFHVTWNRPKSVTDLIRLAREELASRLPKSWKVIERAEARGSGLRADAIIEIRAPDGSKGMVLIEAKRNLEARNIASALEQAKSCGAGTPLVVSDFLTPRARQILAENCAGYADATGNLRLVLSKPALFIESKGADRGPWPDKRPLKSLKGRAAGRVVRALCDLEAPFPVRELAARAGVSPASASRVLAVLDREALVVRDSSDVVNRVQKPELVRRWARDYSLLESNIMDNFLEPRGIPGLLAKLKLLNFRYAVTGALAASWISSATPPPRIVTIFVGNLAKAGEAMDLRRAETGTNVMLAEPFDDVVFERTWDRGGIRCVALSQLCADLLTGPGRDPVEGEELLKKLGESEYARPVGNRIATR